MLSKVRVALLALLDKVDTLLKTEPARLIGYGAAIVIYLVARFLTDRGYISLPLTFDQSLGAAVGAIGTLIVLVESIRRFVYSPQTYIEDLADEAQAAHEAAHLEQAFLEAVAAIKAKQAEKQQPADPAAPGMAFVPDPDKPSN